MYQFDIPRTYFKAASKNKPGCYFCDPCKGSIVQESENFIVLLDTFPIKQGHLMISSKKHYGCAGEIPNEWMLELLSLKENLRKKVEKLEGNAIFYEHGRAGCCMSSNPDGSECNHFHLHCLPASDESVESHLLRTMICNKLSIADRANWENCNDAQPYIQNYIWAKKIWSFEHAS